MNFIESQYRMENLHNSLIGFQRDLQTKRNSDNTIGVYNKKYTCTYNMGF